MHLNVRLLPLPSTSAATVPEVYFLVSITGNIVAGYCYYHLVGARGCSLGSPIGMSKSCTQYPLRCRLRPVAVGTYPGKGIT